MSEKFNAKNLAYNKSLPPFLAALRSQHASSPSGPDPLLAANRRHGAKRSGSAEAEDAPLVVDDGGNVVDARVEGDGTVRCEGAEGDAGAEKGGEEKEGAKTASIGKKRKARVVGAGQEEDEEELRKKKSDGEGGDKAKKSEEQPGEKASGDGKAADGKSTPKPKKKAKKIKLSFDDDT